METVEITANLRQGRGKGPARRMRRQGRVPATFYGPAQSALAIDVDAKEFSTRVANLEGSHLIRLQSSASEISGRVALLRELQVHPVSGAVLHADLLEVDLTKKLVVKVPLHLTGKAIGVTQQGGILQPVMREVSVECLPNDIPEFLEVDVSELSIHDSLHIADIKPPEGVTVVSETNETLVTVLPPQVEQVKAEGEGEAAKEAAPAEAGKAAAPAAKS
jgi:large subunit ribosomal protein L25